MITLSRDDFRSVIAQARLAPSVHNIQPTRWRLTGGGSIELLGDTSRVIPVADPQGRDWLLSHGAALEGLAIGLAARGLTIADVQLMPHDAGDIGGRLRRIATATLRSADGAARGRSPVATRATWRGAFRPLDQETGLGLDQLAAERDDLTLVRAPAQIAELARLSDRAALHFLRDGEHRRELLAWMRLTRSHPLFERDGLNATAMQLGIIEARAARLVLGPLFAALDRVGLAAPLLSEAAKVRTAAAIALFHRPAGEDTIQSGRDFYRAWLAMERHGLRACPMSVLADWQFSRELLAAQHGVPADRRVVNVFRIGRPKGNPAPNHVRLPVDELIV